MSAPLGVTPAVWESLVFEWEEVYKICAKQQHGDTNPQPKLRKDVVMQVAAFRVIRVRVEGPDCLWTRRTAGTQHCGST